MLSLFGDTHEVNTASSWVETWPDKRLCVRNLRKAVLEPELLSIFR